MTNDMIENPTEEDALNGLNAAVRYCEQEGWDETAQEISRLYQRVGRLSVENDE